MHNDGPIKGKESLSRSGNSPWFYNYFVTKHFTKFTRKHLCRCLFFNKFAHCGRTTLLKETPVRVFSKNFAKFIKTTFLENKFAWLLRLYNEPDHPVLVISIFFAANPEGIYDRFRLRILSVCHWRFRTEHGASRKINDNFCKEKVHSKTKLDFTISVHSHPAFTCSDSTKETPEQCAKSVRR